MFDELSINYSMIELNNIKMNVTSTSPNGVVNDQTIFSFKQKGTLVTAEYSGGKIIQGYLVGESDGVSLNFSYCQLQFDGQLDHGISKCDLSISNQGRIKMVEHFDWRSRDEGGVNIFEELNGKE